MLSVQNTNAKVQYSTLHAIKFHADGRVTNYGLIAFNHRYWFIRIPVNLYISIKRRIFG